MGKVLVDDCQGEVTVASSSNEEGNGRRNHFLLTWLTSIGPLVGLTVDLSVIRKWVIM